MAPRLICLLFYISLSHSTTALAQVANASVKSVIKYNNDKTSIQTDENGVLVINVSTIDLEKFKTKRYVSYSDFGALGNGKSDDIDAIAATHAFANQNNLAVKADDLASYYISGKDRTAYIQTNTDFGLAAFIIDDTDVQNRNAPVFEISSAQLPFKVTGIISLRKNQKKINLNTTTDCIITVTDSSVKHYIRFGPNQDKGASKIDIFKVDKKGNVDMNTPVIWDFSRISDIMALPLDKKVLTITGGRFSTIANKEESKYTYFARNINIKRSNVVIDRLIHRVTGEGDQGAPYGGFINISNCAYVTIKNSMLTGHKTYSTIGSAGIPVTMGTYDISINRALNVSFINCSQTNDIHNRTYWGIMGSNYCKNLVLDSCSFSRFDAHKGVANATIRNSVLGHMGINAIGTGIFKIENTRIYGRSLVNLRSDYGSTWQGKFIIQNCIFIPENGKFTNTILINGSYSGQHDFGYTCYMPSRIVIKNLKIDDSNHPSDYTGPVIFANFNPLVSNEMYKEIYPYIKTKEVLLRNVITASGKMLRISNNPVLFKDVKIKGLENK